MFVEQGGGCAICGGLNNDGRGLHVDHNHNGGEVRGLLCYKCNLLLGLCNEDLTLLQKAVIYLETKKGRIMLPVVKRKRGRPRKDTLEFKVVV